MNEVKTIFLQIFTILCLIIFTQSCTSQVEEENSIKEDTVEIEENEQEETEHILSEEYQKIVRPLVNAFKNDNRDAIAELIGYPLRRYYPLPNVRNKAELLERFDEIFSEKIVTEIINSDIEKDWDDVGWRGIMLSQGSLWMDYSGFLISVEYSKREEEIREKVIEAERETLHPSIRNFKKPEKILITDKFKIRIDIEKIDSDGGYIYRYASWEAHQDMSEKPDLIISNGEITLDGSGGNHYYTFVNGDYKYQCSINILGESDTPPADLTVYKREERIVYQRADILELKLYRKLYNKLK